jgi:hypothetical protein
MKVVGVEVAVVGGIRREFEPFLTIPAYKLIA